MEPVANTISLEQSASVFELTDTTTTTTTQHEQNIQTIISLPTDLETVEREPENEPVNILERTTTPTTPNNSPMKHISQRDSSWLEIEVCREFLRGECIRSADECRYAHPTGSVITKDGNKVTCCFDFLKDRCTRETCKYLHPSNVIKDRLVMAGKHYGQVMALTSGKPLLASPLSPAIQPLPVSGAFSFPYSYIGSNSLPSNTVPSPPSSYIPPYCSVRMEICAEFEQVYNCSRGIDHCFFSHPEPHVRINNDNTVSVCWNYLNGYCRHLNCWFYHPTQFQLLAYQLPNRAAIPQQPTLDNNLFTHYSQDSKLTSLQQQISPSMVSPYPFVFPQVMPVSSSFPPSHTTLFSNSLPQTIVS